MNDIFYLVISLSLVVCLLYKPVKQFCQNAVNNHIFNTIILLNEVKQNYSDVRKHVNRIEKKIKIYDLVCKQKINKKLGLFNVIQLQNNKKINKIIKMQFVILEMQKKVNEWTVINTTVSKFLLIFTNGIMSKFSTNVVN